MFDTQCVTGDLVGDAIDQGNPAVGQRLRLLLAQQELLVELAGRASGADALDHDIVLVSRKITQDPLE